MAKKEKTSVSFKTLLKEYRMILFVLGFSVVIVIMLTLLAGKTIKLY